MEKTEFEAVAFLVLLEDVAAQAPRWFNEETGVNVGVEGDMPASQDSLLQRANAGVCSPSGTRGSFEAIAPIEGNTAPGGRSQPTLLMGDRGLELGDEALQGGAHESPPRSSGEVGPFIENSAFSEDDCPSRWGPETADQIVFAIPDCPEVVLGSILDGVETEMEGSGAVSLHATSSGRPHVPESKLASSAALAPAHDAEHPRTAAEALKIASQEGRVLPVHQASAKTKQTSRGNLLTLANGGADTGNADALVAPGSTRVGSWATKRSVLRQQKMNRELARRIAWLEEQLELIPDVCRLQDSESQPRLCYPV